jgi:hypothetical protein
MYFGPERSRLKPKLYTWVFIGADAFSFVLQCAGGGVAAASDASSRGLADVGNNMMFAGSAFRVATMAICGLLAVDFAVRVSKVTDRKVRSVSRPAIFCATSAFAYTVILIRSIYR